MKSKRERGREGRSTSQGQMRLRRHNKLLSPQPKKNELNTCVHVSRGRQGPPPPHEMSTRRHHNYLSLSLLPLHPPPTPPTWRVRALVFIWFYFGLSVICLANTTQRVCPSARLSGCLSVFLFIFRLFAWLLACAIESNYNICEEGSSNHGRHGMARCDTMRS